MQTVAVLGSGMVGEVLANGFLKHGYAVVRGSRDPAKLEGWRQKAGANARTATFGDAAAAAEIVVLAVKGEAAEAALELAGESAIAGKVIVDTTNPIAPSPPQHGVLSFFTTLDDSLMERLQKRFPAARFVKAFSCVGNAQMVNPQLSGGPPTMFICGNDADAKREVRTILDQFGWDTEDLGAAEAARAIEPLCILWCIPGFLRGSWGHALKLLR
jgi:8-hydroxy-5-deazaflavin:NADPH oxidoreductase